MVISDKPFAFHRHTCESAVQRLNEALGGRGVLVEKARKSYVFKVRGWDLNPHSSGDVSRKLFLLFF